MSITAEGGLLAVAPGTATLTATRNGEEALQLVTVMAGSIVPAGTPRWTVPLLQEYAGGPFPPR